MRMDGTGLEGPRGTRPDEIGPVIDLINRVFVRADEGDMSERFPVLFGTDNLDHCRIVLDGARPVAHAASLVRPAVLGGPTVLSACIGAVCTHEAYRGRGLASAILDDVERRLRAAGVDVILISGGRGLYQRRGARTVGVQYRYRISGVDAVQLGGEPVSVRPGGLEDADVLAELYPSNPVRFERSRADWRAWLAAGRCNNAFACPLVAEAAGRPVAYAVHNHRSIAQRPISEAGEWGGAPRHVAALLASMARDRGRDHVEVMVDPAGDAALIERLNEAGPTHETETCGRTVKVLRPAALFEKLRPHLPEPASAIGASDAGAGLRLEVRGRSLSLAVDEVARAFFGDPEGAVTRKLAAAGELGRTLLDALPFPLPRYGYNYA